MKFIYNLYIYKYNEEIYNQYVHLAHIDYKLYNITCIIYSWENHASSARMGWLDHSDRTLRGVFLFEHQFLSTCAFSTKAIPISISPAPILPIF